MHEMFASQVLQGLENLEAIQVQMMSAVVGMAKSDQKKRCCVYLHPVTPYGGTSLVLQNKI